AEAVPGEGLGRDPAPEERRELEVDELPARDLARPREREEGPVAPELDPERVLGDLEAARVLDQRALLVDAVRRVGRREERAALAALDLAVLDVLVDDQLGADPEDAVVRFGVAVREERDLA